MKENMEKPNEIGYKIMIQALKNDNYYEGINNALEIIKEYINAYGLILFKMDNDDNCNTYLNKNISSDITELITIVLNRAKNFIENKDYYKFDIQLNQNISNILFIPIQFNNSKYILTIANNKKDLNKEYIEFINVLKESLTILLTKLEEKQILLNKIEILESSIVIDKATGLENRNSYIAKMTELDSTNTNFVYAIFDLFRLKYINDNFGHDVGDNYISEAANILKHFFPKYTEVKQENGTIKKVYTGSHVYRTGGDEFVVITSKDSKEMVEIKATLISEAVKMLDLGIPNISKGDLPIGINYGISAKENKETTRDLYLIADEALRKNKDEMYEETGLNRRK